MDCVATDARPRRGRKVAGTPCATARRKKRPRRTRERILATALFLFNGFGVPETSMSAIARTLRMSQGNLYYHFDSKEHVVNELFLAFKGECATLPEQRALALRDAAGLRAYLLAVLGVFWRYRFLYRDLNALVSRNQRLAVRWRHFTNCLASDARQLCEDLRRTDMLAASDAQIEALASNMVVVGTFWLSFEYVLDPRRTADEADAVQVLARGCRQVLSILVPFLRGEARARFEHAAADAGTAGALAT